MIRPWPARPRRFSGQNNWLSLARGSGTICRAAYDIFLKLAIQCRYVSDPLFQAMEIGSMKQTDVLS